MIETHVKVSDIALSTTQLRAARQMFPDPPLSSAQKSILMIYAVISQKT
jgi:hypothetical protein